MQERRKSSKCKTTFLVISSKRSALLTNKWRRKLYIYKINCRQYRRIFWIFLLVLWSGPLKFSINWPNHKRSIRENRKGVPFEVTVHLNYWYWELSKAFDSNLELWITPRLLFLCRLNWFTFTNFARGMFANPFKAIGKLSRWFFSQFERAVFWPKKFRFSDNVFYLGRFLKATRAFTVLALQLKGSRKSWSPVIGLYSR